MQSTTNKPKLSFIKRKSVWITIIVIIVVLGAYLVNTALSGHQGLLAFKNTLDKAALLSDQPEAKQVCTDSSGGNESDWNALTYAVWYEKVQDSEDTIRQLTEHAEAIGYTLEYKENSNPQIPQDFTIKKVGDITSIPIREPNFVLKGENSADHRTLSIEAYRGTVNVECNTKEKLSTESTHQTMSSPSGELLLRVGLSRGNGD